MTESDPPPAKRDVKTIAREAVSDLPRWKKALLGVAGLLIVVGFVLMIVEPADGGGTSPSAGTGSEAPTGTALLDTKQQGRTAGGETEDDGSWSGGFFRMGFSFFAGFCLGYTLRAFMKLTALAIGSAMLLLMVLSYFGFVTVEWDKIKGLFDSLYDSVASESGRFRTFITGSLPSAGLATAGLYTGFKKN